MTSNVVTFATHMRPRRRPVREHGIRRGGAVIDLATRIRRAMPRRTPTGVFFVTSRARPHPV